MSPLHNIPTRNVIQCKRKNENAFCNDIFAFYVINNHARAILRVVMHREEIRSIVVTLYGNGHICICHIVMFFSSEDVQYAPRFNGSWRGDY